MEKFALCVREKASTLSGILTYYIAWRSSAHTDIHTFRKRRWPITRVLFGRDTSQRPFWIDHPWQITNHNSG